jgi:diguanylate cyclase (GGDEF)-like protein
MSRDISRAFDKKGLVARTLVSLEKRGKTFWVVAGLALVALLGYLDYVTGQEVSLALFYLVPVGLVTWFTRARFGIAISIASALTSMYALIAAGLHYRLTATYFWNFGGVLGTYVFVTLLLSALKNSLRHERELSRTDHLTGAVNGRLFFDLVQREIERLRRYKHPFTIVYLDLDNFKGINDLFGHTTGDRVLRTVAGTARGHLRRTDVVARLGGDEFALLLPETAQHNAEVVVAKVQRSLLAEMEKNRWAVTFSIGALMCIEAPRGTVDDVVKAADELMYAVKNDGKNAIRYAVHSDAKPVPPAPPMDTRLAPADPRVPGGS